MQACFAKESKHTTPASSCSSKPLLVVQPKLQVSKPSDTHEQEADAVANKVAHLPSHHFVQRKCAECEREDKEKLQRKPISGSITPLTQTKVEAATNVSQQVTSAVQLLKGGGTAMDRNTQSFMERQFGADFSSVQLHTNSHAVQMSRALNAKAFTVGNHVYFNAGQYQPNTYDGRKLLAHELTHVIQQGNGAAPSRIQRWAIAGNTATADSDSDYLGRLAIKAGGSFNDWKCIKPLKMKTSELKTPPADFKAHYENYVQIGDQFDISNLTETGGATLKVYLFDGAAEKMDADIVKLFYPGSSSSTDADMDIDASSNSGTKPIGNMLVFGHAGGNSMWGKASTFTPGSNNPEEPKQSYPLASVGLFPRRCWFTRNAAVRSVGCNSEAFGNSFEKAYLRKGAKITTTTASVRPKCSSALYNAAHNVCTVYDGVDFAASWLVTAASLEGPFWSASAFHGGSYWKEINGKL